MTAVPPEVSTVAAATDNGETAGLARRVAEFTQDIAQGVVHEIRDIGRAFEGVEIGDLGAQLWAFAVEMADLALVILTTVALFLVLRRLARRAFARAASWARGGRDERFATLRRAAAVLFAAGADVLVIAGAWVSGYLLALFAIGEMGAMETRQSLFLNAFLLIEGVKVLLRVVFASKYDDLRLIPLDAEDAAYWNGWLARLTGFIGYGLLVAVPIVAQNLTLGMGRLLTFVIMTVAFAYALIIILQNRQRVRERLAERAQASGLAFTRTVMGLLARVWHLLVIAYFGALAVVTVIRPEDALPFMARATLQTLFVVGGGLFLSVVLTQIIGRKIHMPEETRHRFPLLEERLNAYVPAALKAVRGAILAVVLALVFDAWSLFDFTAWLVSDGGARTVGLVVTLALIIAAAAAIWLAAASWIEHRLSPETEVGGPGARERTLLVLFRNALAVTLVTLTVMVVLAEIGINIGPLIAGAGVLGLAIGFGAQKLVQDIITGIFIQLENAINAGDIITVAGTTGTVERLTIRSVGIRDLAGTYHLIPFSSVDSVSNYSRDFGYHVGNYGVAYREDVDEVIPHLEAAYEELQQDPEQSANVRELVVDGVTSLGDSAVTIRVRIKTAPGTQWGVGRVYNRLVKKRLDAAGIEIPFPHTTVYFGRDKDGTAPPARLEVLQSKSGLER